MTLLTLTLLSYKAQQKNIILTTFDLQVFGGFSLFLFLSNVPEQKNITIVSVCFMFHFAGFSTKLIFLLFYSN